MEELSDYLGTSVADVRLPRGGVPMTPLWHLAEVVDWAASQSTGMHERSTRGASPAEVGFVHCSSPGRLPAVVAAVCPDVVGAAVVLERAAHIDRGRLEVADA